MAESAILKAPSAGPIYPNLRDYEQTCQAFTWQAVRDELSGLPGGRGINLAYEAVDRHLPGLNNHIAFRFVARNGAQRDFSFGELARQSARFANVLRTLGVKPGEHLFAFLGRVPELYIAAVGTLKNRSVFCPLFSQFGPEPTLQRLKRGEAKVLVTTKEQYERKVSAIRKQLPQLQHVILVDADINADPNVKSWARLMEEASDSFEIPPTSPEDPALLHFTSGTTGLPKGALHVHQAGLMHYVTGKYALDFHPQDVFWCTADPGWVTGTSYGIIAPLLHGVTSIVDEAEFDAVRWYRLLQDQLVSVWYTAPTAIRRLMRIPGVPCREYDLSALRLVLSVGEPLNPEAVIWGREALGQPIHDNWWQTETGGIMIANFPSLDIRPGSMGKAMPGIEAAIVKRTNDRVEVLGEANVAGELALRPGWPSMFRQYYHDRKRYEKCFAAGWYLSGDLARRDADGYFWFVGRGDDIIKTSGHMVGPFEVESALMEHPAVAEVAVIGKPDPLIGELVKAFVVTKVGQLPDERLRLELLGFGRRRLGPAVAPKEIAFVQELPKTRSGKILRRLLKARELNLPEGDLSTLELDS
jgi:acetyl-CoA synthetase